MNIPKLSFEELIAPWLKINRVLTPRHIPIHPDVYDSDFAYTQNFADEVHSRVPDAMLEDLSKIEKILGERPDVQIQDEKIISGYYEIDLDRIACYATPGEKKTGVLLGDTNMDISPRISITITLYRQLGLPEFRHPIPREKAEHYDFKKSADSLTAHTWHTHKQQDQGIGFQQYLRAFAVMFNNVGLEKLKSQSK